MKLSKPLRELLRDALAKWNSPRVQENMAAPYADAHGEPFVVAENIAGLAEELLKNVDDLYDTIDRVARERDALEPLARAYRPLPEGALGLPDLSEPLFIIAKQARYRGVSIEALAASFGRAIAFAYGPPPYPESCGSRPPLSQGVRAELLAAFEHIWTKLYEHQQGDSLSMGQPTHFEMGLTCHYGEGRSFCPSFKGDFAPPEIPSKEEAQKHLAESAESMRGYLSTLVDTTTQAVLDQAGMKLVASSPSISPEQFADYNPPISEPLLPIGNTCVECGSFAPSGHEMCPACESLKNLGSL